MHSVCNKVYVYVKVIFQNTINLNSTTCDLVISKIYNSYVNCYNLSCSCVLGRLTKNIVVIRQNLINIFFCESIHPSHWNVS